MSLRDAESDADRSGGDGDGDILVAALWELAPLVRRQLSDALQALGAADLGLADAVVRADVDINRRRYAIEEVAAAELRTGVEESRLRLIIATLNVISDLERMGDHAEGIAKVALMLGRPPAGVVPATLLAMGRRVEAMLERGLETFRRRDSAQARAVGQEDDIVDQMYEGVYAELLARMTSDSDAVVPTAYLLWATHNLERIADRITNICERTVYLSTGRVEELNVSNY